MYNNHNQSQSPLSNASHSQTVGVRGPVLVQDTVLHETLEDFVFSTTLPRRIHTKGYGAFGYFYTTHSMKQYTKAGFLQTPNKQVPVAVRFSLASSNKGTPDTLRNVRGFSTRFYTEEGIFDLLCNHLPVFFVRDAIRVPDIISHLSPSPVNNLPDPERLWSMFAEYPESTNMLIWFFSDLGTVKSLRHIKGYSVSTYVWRNAQGVRNYVKYHWFPMAGVQYIDQQEAQRLACEDPDIAGRDLYDSIAKGNAVEYEMRVQLMNPEDAKLLPFDPLDDTKVWDEAVYPLLPVGRMVLNCNPENYADQVDKLAFNPANLLPGLEFSDDKVLQGRTFIYSDAQRHRLGPDYRNIPVNKQLNWSPASMVSSGNGRYVAGEIMRAEIPNPDDFTQASQRYESFSATEKKNLANNIASGLVDAQPNTQRTVLRHLERVSPALADMVRNQMLLYSGTVRK
ncbi:catalase [Sedimentibacter hydroxybenzoicus DSM 7310]|uniref:catalase n=1 Tax=Sedimentibacter hydroxybenzoicus DSM 7310 TaxID=1123245 RepID=A0A974GVW2_SEDHY|nr:catalase [Sedimentibacter hydroxybenzoicus]NYB73809.1 catalase [Sedimentibacter hydroxybenzoicus DSM 7310]